MRTRVLVASVLATVAAAALAAQQPQPPQPARGTGDPQPPVTFKVEVNYVEIDAVVTDAQGNFVRNLTKDDFQISEEGKPQTVSMFSLVDIPVEKFDPPLHRLKPIEPDVRSNKNEFNGRVFVIVLDDLHTNFARSGRVKAAAKQFIERYLGANDVAAVVQTGGGKETGQEFTSSRERLLRAVDKFMGQKERSATLEKLDDYRMTQGSGIAPRDTAEPIRAYKARNTFTALKNVADYMAGIRGRRKAVVFFSEGVDYDIYDQITNRFASEIQQYGKDAIAAATRANVSFYAVDPRGLTSFDDAGADVGAFPIDQSLGLNMQAIQNEMRIAQDSLKTISDETGGFASVDSNDFKNSFGRIVRDNSSYYVLGYYSTDTRRDGQFRSLAVRVKRQGLQIRARKGYVAPKGRPPQGTPAPKGIAASIAMRETLNSPVPVTGLGLTATAAPMAGAAGSRKTSVLVIVEVDGRNLKFKEEGGVFANEIEVAILATDENAKVHDGVKDTAQLNLRPETHATIIKNGVRMTRRLELPAGRYQLRIGAREVVGGLVGSVLYDLDVPDFSKGDLVMGGLLLTAASVTRIPTASPDPDFKGILPASPSTIREFPSGDTLTLAVDVYDNRAFTPHRVEIRTSLTTDEGTVVFNSQEERKSEELKGATGTFGHVATVPLKGVAPGRYVLKVDAKSLLSNGGTASREVEIQVR